MLEIAQVLKLSSELKKYFNSNISNNSNSFILLEDIFSSLYVNDYIVMEITNKIIDENTIADNASPTLLNLRKKRRILEQRLKDKLQDLVHSKSKFMMDSIITIRDGRYVVPVKEEYRNEIKGLVHDISSSGSTLYIEPITTFEMNNEIQNIKVDEEKEIIKILKELTLALAPLQDAIFSNIDTIGNLDLIFAKASYSSETNGNEPILNKDKYLNFVKVRHPLINKNVVVPIDIEIGKDFSCLVITGPNTGGKTATLKTVGLNLLLSYSGIYPLCNIGTSICVFDKIFIDIGDEQSIQASLSTFSSHMTNIVSFLKQVDEHSLVLFDELGAGTDPTEGAALATSILNHLHSRGIRTMATTHYSELKVYALSTPGVENASCEFDVETLRPTYRLLIGIPGKSNAFAIASRLGVPDYIIEDAKTHLTEQDESFEDILTDLETSRKTLDKERETIAAYKREIERLKMETSQKQEKLEAQRDRILREANEKAHAILEDAKETADETMRNFHKFGKANISAAEMEKERERLRKKMAKTRSGMTPEPAKPKKQYKPSDFKLGESVKVLSMNLTGSVVSLPDAKGNLDVQMGILRSKVNISDLEIIDEKPNYLQKTSKRTGKGKIKMNKSLTVATEINLLGKTVDEAVAELDKYLDDASLAHLSSVRIVHGKGTGALRQGIHKYLKRQKHVKSFRLGAFGEGDAGVTIAELR